MADIKPFPRPADAKTDVPVIDKDWITREAVDLIATCKSSEAPGALAAQKNALELLAKVHGLITEQRINRNITSIQDLTEDELAALSGEQGSDDATEPNTNG